MLERTFQHLPGVSAATERRLWNEGIADWNAFLTATRIAGISRQRKAAYDRHLRMDLHALGTRDWNRFRAWPIALHYRAIPHLRTIIYLDIETYGVRESRVTLIGLSDSEHVRILSGSSVDRSMLDEVLASAEAIVTYNGCRFDLPYLAKAYHLAISAFTIDLEPLCAKHGLQGGLKRVENALGIERDVSLRGGDALALWRSYRASGDTHFLDLLTAYVEQDVMSLPIVLEEIMRKEEHVMEPDPLSETIVTS